ncbi:TetR/AcrR family transcriptional regulator [Pseudomonas sp. GD03860]|uniref:TetR/AcrR family transcriptional regulator n=1 Tax=Pseudomonas TaxID=286 RepID=UPI0023638469|nr:MULTISPECIES: TetR/AcrR family transcriptional regulator [Pseudomonas]MDD2058168.1 TetR/AcrR family transcriptional regulator [Pseudomonas putida]MDH0636101.1 TetR/AcrR family transcriptional regulator [Pseudomonas sp. GD03860]
MSSAPTAPWARLAWPGTGDLTMDMHYLDGIARQWQREQPAGARADVKLVAFIACHVRYHLEHPDQDRLGKLDFKRLDTAMRSTRGRYRNYLQRMLDQGREEGSLHCADPQLMARTLFNQLTHACIWHQADGRWDVEEVIEHYAALVLKMLGALPATVTNRCRPATVEQCYGVT